LRSFGRDGNLLVGCPSFLHSAQGGWTHGGRGVMSSFFFCLPPTVAVVLVSAGVGGAVGVGTRNFIESPSV
jgi:hypothetical protein